MAKYRPIDVRLWNDRKFLSLSDDGRVLWLFLLTAPTTLAIPGIVIGGEAALAEHLGWTAERLREGFRELFAKGLSVRVENRLVWLPNALKYQPPCNPNMVKAWAKAWDDVPESSLKHDIWQALKVACDSWGRLFSQLFAEPLADGSDNRYTNGSANRFTQDQEQKQEQDPEETYARARERHPEAGRILDVLWKHGAKRCAELKLAKVPSVTPWPLNAGGDHPGRLAILDRVGELLVEHAPAEAERIALNRIDVAAAKAKADADGSWFAPLTMFTKNSFVTWAHLDPEQFARRSARTAERDSALGTVLRMIQEDS